MRVSRKKNFYLRRWRSSSSQCGMGILAKLQLPGIMYFESAVRSTYNFSTTPHMPHATGAGVWRSGQNARSRRRRLVITKWAWPFVFEPKKDRWLHFWVYCRRLTAITERDFYFILWLNKYYNLLSKAQIISVLDASSGYRHRQIEIKNKYINNMKFVAHHELFKYTRIPPGL